MKTDYIKPSTYNKIYHLMQYENALALRLSLETGLRIGDALSLKPDDLEGCSVRYTAQKTGKSGKKTISADLAKRLRHISDKHFVFPGRSGDKPRTRQAVWADVKKACKRLGIKENVGCHSARKTYAVELFHEEGLPKVQKELQHDRGDTTMLYAFADVLTGKEPTRGIDYETLSDMVAEKVVQEVRPMFEKILNICSIDR